MARKSIRTILPVVASLFLVSAVFAASPRLSNIQPRGIQRGAEHVLTFNGSNLGDAQEIFFYETAGFEVAKLEAAGNNVKVTLKVSADCRLGEHVAQVRTASGISDYRTFFIEALPAADEKEPNSDFDKPQVVALNTVINGSVGSEDVDYYIVEAKKGQRISAEVVAMRLSTALFDPYVAILDGKRFELASNDDTPLALQDCFASIIAPEDGKYTIEVRESAYGNGNRYRLHIGTFPRPTAIYPSGGKLGDKTEVRYLGVPGGELKATIDVPPEMITDFGVFAQDDGGITPTANVFRQFEFGNAFEAEPNNQRDQASAVELPLAFNGIIQEPGDIDFFKFTAKKGQQYEVECYARRVRSGLDPVMNLYDAAGKSIAGNDDSRGPDSYFRFNVPSDGEYVIRLTDHLGRGGPDLVYRIEFQPIRPRLTLGIPRVERYGQYRQQIYVARGNRFATIINASRSNFGGELSLDSAGLPAGIKMNCENMATNLNSMPVVFEAAADAPLSGKLVDFLARHADPKQNIKGGFRNRADYIVSAPGQSLYRWKDVDRLAIAVVDEIPFKIEIVVPKVPLVRAGSMQLKIVAHKKEGWDEQINVQLPFRPPGVSAGSSVNIPKGKTEILYPINASGNAQVKEWKVFALGSSGGMWASSQLAKLVVAEAYASFQLQRASCEQGEEAEVFCKIAHKTAFDGNAKAELLGLPPGVVTSAMEFNKETAELTFKMTTTDKSPAGKHNLLCRLTITQNGEPIVSRGGGVQLQIDKPLPPEPNQPPPPKPKVVAKKPDAKPEPEVKKPKPLTRLEKLRLAAKKRQEAKAAAAKEQGGGGGE